MNLTIRCAHWIFALIALTSALEPVRAQGVSRAENLPDISRVCLWNADRATWKALGLKKAEIERMRQLRLLYPAVVDGQWITVDQGTSTTDSIEWNHGGPNGNTSTRRGASAPVQVDRVPSSTAPQEGLQNDLREVLTPKQLRKWAILCSQ